MLTDKKLYSLTLTVLVGVCASYFAFGIFTQNALNTVIIPEVDISQGTTLVAISLPPAPQVTNKVDVFVTAYSSTPDQTDDTPFITASGEMVRDGIIANNLLSFGTAVRMPELFDDKIFIVKDRMHRRKSDNHFDIWFPTKEQAIEFGAQTATLEILAN